MTASGQTASGQAAAGRVRAFYDRAAPQYDRSIRVFERLLFGDGRAWVCSQARGDTLEIGVGTGRNLSFYPPAVRLTGLDLSPAMLAVARRRAAGLAATAPLVQGVTLVEGDAQALPFLDASFDTVVCTLALCTIPDDRHAVREARRVLRPSGRLLLLEHVRSPLRPVWPGQWLLDGLFVRLGGDHLLRDPLDYLQAEGFTVVQCERSKWGIVERAAARRAGA